MGYSDNVVNAESGGDPNSQSTTSSLASGVIEKDLLCPRVGKLLFSGRPPAILRGVIPITINAVNRMIFAGTFAHISKKAFKASAPLFANLDASTAVVWIRRMAGVLTSLDHAAPYLILRRSLTPTGYRDGHSMSAIGLFGRLNLVAPATQRIAGFKIGDGGHDFIAAIAAAKQATNGRIPILANFRIGFAQNRQSFKFQPNVIFTAAH